MSDAKRMDEWLQKAARSPAMRDLLARAEAQPDLPEEVLADYFAGELSPAEQQLVEKRIAASESMSRFLAEMDADVVEATPEPVREPVLARVQRRASAFFANLVPAQGAWRLATGLAALVLVFGLTARVADRPPGVGPEYGAAGAVRGPSELQTMEIAGGSVDLVDVDWPLRQPVGEVGRVRWFAWDPVRGASAYDFELRDASGRTVFAQAGLHRSTKRLPWTVRRSLAHGAVYTWIVTAKDEAGAAVRRGVERFRVQ